jgi:hypothetical protein
MLDLRTRGRSSVILKLVRTATVALALAGTSIVGAAASQTAYAADSNVATSTAAATHRETTATAKGDDSECGYWESTWSSYWTNCGDHKVKIQVFDDDGEWWFKCVDLGTTELGWTANVVYAQYYSGC